MQKRLKNTMLLYAYLKNTNGLPIWDYFIRHLQNATTIRKIINRNLIFLSKSKKFNDSINIAESNIVNTVLKTETITKKTYLYRSPYFLLLHRHSFFGISALGYYITRYRTVKRYNPILQIRMKTLIMKNKSCRSAGRK